MRRRALWGGGIALLLVGALVATGRWLIPAARGGRALPTIGSERAAPARAGSTSAGAGFTSASAGAGSPPAEAAPVPHFTAEAYARLLADAARTASPPPDLVVVETPAGPTVVDHGPALVASPPGLWPREWVERSAAAQAPAPAAGRGGPEDLARLRAILASQQGAEGVLDRWGRRLVGWVLGRVRRDPSTPVPPWLPTLLGLAVAALAGLAGVAVVALLVRQVRHLRSGDSGIASPVRVRGAAGPGDPAAYLEAARAAAARGEIPAALSHLYAGVLATLSRQGHLRLRPSGTGRAYLRELGRTAPELAPAFAALTEFCEARWYGGMAAAPDDLAAALQLAAPLLEKEVAP